MNIVNKAIAKHIFILLLVLTTSNANAGKLYGSVAWDWAAITSNREFINGASGSTIGFDLGYRFDNLSLETFYRNFELEEVFTDSRGDFDILVADKMFGFGIRYNHVPWIHSKLGWAFHKIEGSFPRRQGGFLNSNIDGSFGGFYIGFGLKWWGTELFDIYSDLTFHRASSQISHMGFGLGLRWYFLEL